LQGPSVVLGGIFHLSEAAAQHTFIPRSGCDIA
jgi:hypothetical protein